MASIGKSATGRPTKRKAISQAIWVIGIPGIFLTITVLAINLAGDGLRDILDPKLARRM